MPTLRPHSLTEIYDLLYEKHEGDIDRLNAETQKIKVKYITRSKLQARDGNINWDDRSGRYEIHEIIDTDITHVNIFDEPMTNMYMVIMSVMMMVQDLGDDIIVFYEDDLKYIKSKGIEGTNVSDFGITLSEQAAI
jgi:hypothetical protein